MNMSLLSQRKGGGGLKPMGKTQKKKKLQRAKEKRRTGGGAKEMWRRKGRGEGGRKGVGGQNGKHCCSECASENSAT